MKKLITRLIFVLVAIAVVALVAAYLSLNSIVKKGVETVGPQLTKVETRLGGVSLSPWSGHGRLSELFFGNPAGYKTPSSIKVGDIRVAVKPASVISDTVVVDDINIQAPEITFEGSLRGNNLSKILENLEAASAGPSKPEPTGKSEKKFLVKQLVIQGGKIHLSVTALGGQATTLSLPDLHLQNIGTGDGGVPAAELARQIMKPLLLSVTKAVTEGLANLSKEAKELADDAKEAGQAATKQVEKSLKGVKEIGKDATQQIDKASKGIKDLFKKKSD